MCVFRGFWWFEAAQAQSRCIRRAGWHILPQRTWRSLGCLVQSVGKDLEPWLVKASCWKPSQVARRAGIVENGLVLSLCSWWIPSWFADNIQNIHVPKCLIYMTRIYNLRDMSVVQILWHCRFCTIKKTKKKNCRFWPAYLTPPTSGAAPCSLMPSLQSQIRPDRF